LRLSACWIMRDARILQQISGESRAIRVHVRYKSVYIHRAKVSQRGRRSGRDRSFLAEAGDLHLIWNVFDEASRLDKNSSPTFRVILRVVRPNSPIRRFAGEHPRKKHRSAILAKLRGPRRRIIANFRVFSPLHSSRRREFPE